MKFDKLRLLGFKSFVEPTEFIIQDGLTGVVGPNGCGKSNLVEALRWVMGENSYKNMRASSMDDVIFSGSGNRPSRNTAEVGLFLDNDDRTAPAAFNDAEELQVSRRIERESGSVYRINGKDVRAKDVQLLFADVSTGARSPSMIGQGRIGELISAKPQARRALLEEAAGISGLHSRRHDAELRLRAAETNLERLDDVIGQMEGQLESLKRQARQANRYRNIAGDIRKAEATILHLKWSAAKQATLEAETILTGATMRVGETSLVQTEAAKAQAIIASKLPDLRDKEVKAAAALQRIMLERKQLDQEAERATIRQQELSGRIEQLKQDIAREEQLVAENSDIISHLEREENQLRSEADGREERESTCKTELQTAEHQLTASEEKLNALTRELAAVRAQSEQANRNIRDSNERADKLRDQAASVEADLAILNEQMGLQVDVIQKGEEVARLEIELKQVQQQVTDAEAARETASAVEQNQRQITSDARSALNAIETEAKTLSRMLNAGGVDLFPSVLDSVTAQSGFEIALGAALGDDLDVALDASAAAYWSLNGTPDNDPALPSGIESLKSKIVAPPELSRRLSQIGLVSKQEGDRLCGDLLPGQRLVTVQGDLWRWDGYRASAEAPTAAALRLEQKNRLAELDEAAKSAFKALRDCEQQLEAAHLEASQAQENQQAARQQVNSLLASLDTARRALSAAEKSSSEIVNRRSALEEAKVRLESSLKEALDVAKSAEAALIALPDVTNLEAKSTVAQNTTSQHRAKMAETRATFETMARESKMRQERLEAIGRERKAWNDRAIKADRQIQVLRNRLVETENQQAEVVDIPADIEAKSRSMVAQIDAAETERKLAADQLAVTENQLREADKVAADMLATLSDAKQESVRAEERLEAAKERRREVEVRIREDLNCEPHLALQQTGQSDETKLAEVEAVETKLERLKSERERLGAVNLRADEEQQEILKQKDDLVSERDDLIEAIRRLRQGIQSLNKEGRERLLTAFDEVNIQFMKLFTHLFGGGTAELQLVESDDPLEAGLEILARPPGKKPQTMTLLSGGEQALTALALIFAVFLTNPAPICVLDEVDAPLDDHNVERFCNLMDQMCAETDTKFVIITHNPITMARMDRLFGVTMAERGVSQLVSVDLQTAETFLEAS